MGKTVDDVLNSLAAHFGTTVAHLWGVMVRQVYVTAISDTLQIIVGWVVVVWLYKRFKSAFAGGDGSEEVFIPLGLAVLVLAVIMIIVTLIGIDAITQIFNPEYGAINMVLTAMGK